MGAPLMPTYDMGMSVSTGGNYNLQRISIEASNITEAIEKAEETFPGFKVHHAWCIDGCRPVDESGLEEWMATHKPGVVRTQRAGDGKG